MVIQRIIKGKVYDFELTQEEMLAAVTEYADLSYVNFIREQIEELDESDERAVLKHLDEEKLDDAIKQILRDFKYLIEDAGYDEFEAWNQASIAFVN